MSDAMASPVVTVDPDMGVVDLMRLFVTAGIGGAPVVDANGTPMGVVSKTDLLRELYDQSGSAERAVIDPPAMQSSPEPSTAEATGRLCRARDLMTPDPVVVKEGTSLAHAAGLMAQDHLHRVFVVDDGGAIKGVLASSDIVHWLAHEDEDAEP